MHFHTIGLVHVLDRNSGEKLLVDKKNYDKTKHKHHNEGFKHSDGLKEKLSKIRLGFITAKDWDGKFHRISKDDDRIKNGEFGNTTSKRWVIEDFQTWEMEIDFNYPELVQNKLGELTLAVEEECPIGKAFGFSVLENNTAYEDENGNIWFENETLPNFTNPIKDKLKPIFKEKRIKNYNGVNFIKFSLK